MKALFGRYEFVSGTSSKFWDCSWDEKSKKIISSWGKIGYAPQGTKELTYSEANVKIMEKIKKGYKKCGDHSFSSAVEDKKILKSMVEQMEKDRIQKALDEKVAQGQSVDEKQIKSMTKMIKKESRSTKIL